MTGFARLAVIGGMLAWIVALVVVVLAVRQPDRQDDPARSPTAIVLRPTLAAATATSLPSATPTETPQPSPTPTASATATATALPPTVVPLPILTATPSQSPPSATPVAVAQVDAVATATPAPESDSAGSEAAASGSGCVPPDGWERYTVQTDDTLFAFVLGAGATLSVDDLIAANCLSSRYLQVGQVLYLPPGAAENAPPSVAVASSGSSGAHGPRTPNCPCTITISAGWRREQIADAIDAAQTLFTGADFLDATGPGATAPFAFVTERPGGTSLEGFLLPGTYTVQNDTTAAAFRDMLLSAFDANVGAQVRADAAAQGVTFYQALIIASIVQREVAGPETQKLVASVYYNRYRDGNRLGTTVAVQYALGVSGNWWPRVTSSGLQVDSPYNTYTRAGLPPTPIDNPGLSAILAAVYPPQTEYRYHTAGCHGEGEVFAVTYEEHLANVNCQ